MDNPVNYWYQKYLQEKKKNEGMIEALRTEYEKGRADAFAQMQKEWSEEDEKMIDDALNMIEWYDGKNEKKLSDWFKSLKDRVQPKQEWSEEDETKLTNTIIMLKEGASLHFNKKDITKAVDWIKSLKQKIKEE